MKRMLSCLLLCSLPLYGHAGEKATDWCVVRAPDVVHAGEDLVIEVEYKGLQERVTIFADLHYNRANGHWAGKLARGGAFGAIQGDGTVEVRLPVPRAPGKDVAAVFGAIFISPKGWDERVDAVNSTPSTVKPPRPEVYAPVELASGYTDVRPRLLFGPADRNAMREKLQTCPDLWAPVLRQARGLASYVPEGEAIRKGAKYWRSEWIFSGALAAWLLDEPEHAKAAISWMTAHCLEDTWGVGWRENIDLYASWYLYYISLAYDLLKDRMTPLEEAVVRRGLIDHARAIYDARDLGRVPYDQNHTYIPATALATAALTFKGELPEADAWLVYAHDMLDKCRTVLTPDGYYYEGTGYWEYAIHWHVRYADLLSRATGRDYHDLPFFKKNHLYPLHLGLPGAPFLFDIADTGSGVGRRAKTLSLGRKAVLYRYAKWFDNGVAQALADRIRAQGADSDDPAMTFLWYSPAVSVASIEAQPTYHHFEDFGVLCWRSSWADDATVCMFKCGPPSGYSAAAKLEALPKWRPNTGHVHPDIGMFWIYADGAYLATDTGYTSRKQTRDHNTILVDGKGMGEDRNYWVYSGFPDRDIPYSTWTPVKLEKVHMEKDYAYALGDFSTVYPEELGKLTIRRHFIAMKDVQVVYDELGGDSPHTYTSLLHADQAFNRTAPGHWVSVSDSARLGVHVLLPSPVTATAAAAMCFQKGSPNTGKEESRGYELALATPKPVQKAQFLTVLVPGRSDAAPISVRAESCTETAVVLLLDSPGGRARRLTLDLGWKASGASVPGRGPVGLQTVR